MTSSTSIELSTSENDTASATTSAPRSRREVVFLALALASASAIALGFGRFGYDLVLPAMRQDLGWAYGAAGLMNTANAFGYLAGAVSTTFVLKRFPNRTVLLVGLAIAVSAMCLAGAFRTFGALLVCRALVGWSGALVFISASGLAARLGRSEDENALAMGITVAGPGFGTIATNLLVPFALGDSITHWPRAWVAMGALGAAVWLGLSLVTQAFEGREGAATHSAPGETNQVDFSSMPPVLVSYFLFGVGYIAI